MPPFEDVTNGIIFIKGIADRLRQGRLGQQILPGRYFLQFLLEVLIVHIQALEPLVAEAAPVVEPRKVSVRLAEELELHLLELADAEDEVARRDLVAEALL